ncbi:hypothetical protein [Bradyrhizobium guangzhouense]|uniref:Lipoprotein n=1 Tax=Bradyrhizobium guangzhouense TaxID=1325095 RepID=A0AAE6C5D7_9BRAD|nr:hypothetical protein [Bradyrhizobium guangzhouense]QAU43899.1 hypothetical protein XH91_00030 [Bradyrhizobium guangzhouense]RXH17990.1 hypothetical protein EAS56_02690 [Bradyrhizobium guangzhouense]
MAMVKRGPNVPARWRLLVCGLVLLAGCAKQPLTADPQVEMPAPKQSSFSQFRTTHALGAEAPLRTEIEARVPAELSEVLAFYRRELGQRSWQEKPDDAVIAVDRVQLAFVSPKGPAVLKLGRAQGETTISLAQRNPEVAAKADMLPTSGKARLIFGYLRPDVASLVINDRTIEIAGGENHPQTLDLPPGTYPYELRASGLLLRADTVTLAAGEAWDLSDDNKPSQIY